MSDGITGRAVSTWQGCWHTALMSQVMESEEFMLLPANQLIDIISSDELNVRSEEQVFNAVMAWVKYSIQERRPQLPQVSWRNVHGFCHPFWFWYVME